MSYDHGIKRRTNFVGISWSIYCQHFIRKIPNFLRINEWLQQFLDIPIFVIAWATFLVLLVEFDFSPKTILKIRNEATEHSMKIIQKLLMILATFLEVFSPSHLHCSFYSSPSWHSSISKNRMRLFLWPYLLWNSKNFGFSFNFPW